MNEVTLVGKMSSKIVETKNDKTVIIFIKIKSIESGRYECIPVYFKNVNKEFFLSLSGKEIAISGHIESKFSNRIYADIISIN